MKAAVSHRYGPPEVVGIQELPIPQPQKNEIRVKVMATTVNRTDTGFRSAMYFVSRFWSGLFKPKYPIWGSEFSGVVDTVGEGVTQFKSNDKVFGYNDKSFGAHAEYLCISENSAISLMPKNLNFIESAPLTEGAHYALNNIKAAKVKNGDRVMVYGATGAIGSSAVQLLKANGAWVCAVGNTKNLDLLKQLGADAVVDYQTQDYTITSIQYDFIFDAVGKSAFKKIKHMLKPKGIYISTELGKRSINIFLAVFTPLFGSKRVLFPIPNISQEDVLYLKELAENGQFMPVIDSVFDLDDIVGAHRYAESGQKTGNLVVKVNVP
jgi:NADPH:quinone reductase-like Zn-dependent oxidoreductase